MRIALIHALTHSIAPINDAFMQMWPEATRVNLLDDSLSADLAANQGVLDEAMFRRACVLPVKRMVDRVRAVHPNARIIGFPKGSGALMRG